MRARQLLVTQPVPRTQGNGTLDPQNLFFDSESRAVQSAAAAEDDANAAESLTLSVKLCNLLNKMQTTDQTGRVVEGGTSRSVHVPPEVPPRLFAVPEKQQVVPNLRAPEARSDLVDLMRVVNDHSESTDSNLHWPPPPPSPSSPSLSLPPLPSPNATRTHESGWCRCTVAASMGVTLPHPFEHAAHTHSRSYLAHQPPTHAYTRDAGPGERHRTHRTFKPKSDLNNGNVLTLCLCLAV